jgi:starvation-inducible DNA-binding protein
MATATAAHLPSLGAHQREEAGSELQGTLVELIALARIGKQLHWNVTGTRFRALHPYLDELVDSWQELSDAVAERAVALGVPPDGQIETVAESSRLKGVTPGPIPDHEVVDALVRRVGEVAERSRERMDHLAEIDAASQDVLVEVVRALEEQLWMIRSQLA